MSRFVIPARKFVLATLAVWSLSLVGCGQGKGSVAGKVALDGTPLKGGRVDFVNTGGGAGATVEIDGDGGYAVPVLMAGDYAVTVSTEYLKPNAAAGGMPGARAGGMTSGPPPSAAKGKEGPVPKEVKAPANMTMPEGYKPSMPGDAAKKYVKIPAKYADIGQSGLKYTFAGGTQTFDIPLTTK